MTNALRDHQAIDAIGGEVFHVAIEQTRAFAVQHAVAITNHSADCGARSVRRDLPGAIRSWSQIGLSFCVVLARVDLIRKRKLFDSDLVLIRMSGPRPVHPT